MTEKEFNEGPEEQNIKPNLQEGWSVAQHVFRGKEILTKRPAGMDFLAYRILRSHQTKMINKIFAKDPNPKIQQMMGIRRGYNQHFR